MGPFSTRYSLPIEGDALLHLCGNSEGIIEQEFMTVPGTEYQLSFSYAANPESEDKQGLRLNLDPTNKVF